MAIYELFVGECGRYFLALTLFPPVEDKLRRTKTPLAGLRVQPSP